MIKTIGVCARTFKMQGITLVFCENIRSFQPLVSKKVRCNSCSLYEGARGIPNRTWNQVCILAVSVPLWGARTKSQSMRQASWIICKPHKFFCKWKIWGSLVFIYYWKNFQYHGPGGLQDFQPGAFWGILGSKRMAPIFDPKRRAFFQDGTATFFTQSGCVFRLGWA